MIRLFSSGWETFPWWGHDQSHIWLNGFPPLRHTVHHCISENWGRPNFYTSFIKMGKSKAGGLSSTDVRCRHLCGLTNQKESDCVIPLYDSTACITCRKANASKVSAADTSAFHFQQQNRKVSAFLPDCMLWTGCVWEARKLCEFCARLSSMVLPLSWLDCQGGAELHCMCKGKVLQVGGCWEKAELWF